MPFVQRSEVGEIVGLFANRQPDYAEEWLDDSASELSVVTPSQLAAAERSWRDGELMAVRWLRERHRDQLDIEVDTAISGEQFKDLLVYMQALRDWPQSPGFPDSQHRPLAPIWIEEQIE